MRKFSLLLALLCASVMGWATVYDDTALSLDAGETAGQTLTLSICKSGANTTQVVAKSSTSVFTGVYECIWQQYGGGSNPIVGEYTVTDHEISFTTTWDTYPTSATQLRFVARRNNSGGGSDIFGGTATSAEITGECAGGGSCTDETVPTVSAVSVGSITYNSAVLTVTASDNIGVTGYIVKNGASQIASSATSPITITGLTAATTYDNIKVIAKDACNNESAEFAVTSFTTGVRSFCSFATGHLGQANFGDANGRILLTLTKLSASSVGVTVEPNNGGADVFDFVEVILGGVSKTLGSIGGSVPTTSEIVYDGLASLDFNINVLWHHKTWADAGGRWTTNQFSVTEAELCPAPAESEYCAYEDPQTIKNGKNIALTWETDESGNVVIKMSNGTGTTSCSFRNGGFEGGIAAFVVSDDDFATTAPASNYFTAVQVYSGNTYTLTKTADLPANAKIKHVGSGHALAWVLDGNNEYCFPDFIYTYGSVCTEEPELTSIALSASASIAQVGSGITLTASPLDQFGAPIEATINYAISPADAGSISGNVFTFAKTGAATITASSGAVEESITLYCVSSANIALNKTCEAGYQGTNSGEWATAANDGNESSAWVTWSWQDPSVEWWYVDLGALYDITAISVLWGADYSSNYILQVRDEAPAAEDKANDEAWTTVATVTTASANNVAMNYVTTTGRYVRLHSLNRSTGAPCIRLRELQVFGSEASTPTKSVSATPNDPSMGTATVKQGGVDVPEVETGTTVTFSAVANEGYIFVNWSNDNTNASFDAEVNESMNLTANFRALGTVYCNTAVTSTRDDDVHTAYVTMKRTSANHYALIVRSEEALGNFTNTELLINGGTIQNLNNQGTLSNGNHMLSYEFTSTTEPSMHTPYLYLNVPGSKFTECWFTKLTNIEFDVPCDDDVSVTAISLNRTTANLLISHTLTLIPTFTPVYATDNALTWETSNSSIATVDNGVVTGVTEGNVTITAKLTSDNSIYATCNVHVVASLTEATLHGYEFVSPQEGQTVFTYSITRSVEQKLTFTMTTDKNVVGFVAFININGADHELTGYGAEYTASYTTADTYEDNTPLNCMWDFRSALYRETIDFTYYVGAENEALKILTIDENVDNTSNIGSFNGQTVELGIVNRSFTADKLYTLVLPFNADAAQTAEKLPGQLTKLNNTYVKDNGDLRVNFVDVDAIEAGVPYLYVPSANVTNSIFENVTVSSTLVPATPVDGLAKYYGIYDTKDADALKAITHGYVLGSDQYLYDVQDLPSTQTMKALRGYFVLNFPSAASGAPKRIAKVVFNSNEKEETTGIEDVQDGVQCMKRIENGMLYIIRDGKTYNVQGQLVK